MSEDMINEVEKFQRLHKSWRNPSIPDTIVWIFAMIGFGSIVVMLIMLFV